ncbi:hypothetical protein PLEOSDRAFT_1090527 [Pleurotus ostreatus PC15]|uniref:Uncharacterized protein n=1 Tax=Pleurotus ostreatus (strain PC15) TaxID=1137138 RepID=A0A067NLL3_PLEO1|nr:hypothetical protein PLEOSDRAFT_1090527 [Pleurotus ostreatus PC15]
MQDLFSSLMVATVWKYDASGSFAFDRHLGWRGWREAQDAGCGMQDAGWLAPEMGSSRSVGEVEEKRSLALLS